MTTGLESALTVPSSGMLIWKSDRTSSRNASNSSSARSISSMSSTARSPCLTASSSGRSSRNFGPNSWSTDCSSVGLGLRQRPDLQHLPGVVPLVQRLAGADALVALQPDELAAEDRREDLRDLRLADADLAFEQHRPAQRKRHEQGGGQPAVGEVTAVPQAAGELGYGPRVLAARVPACFAWACAASCGAPPGSLAAPCSAGRVAGGSSASRLRWQAAGRGREAARGAELAFALQPGPPRRGAVRSSPAPNSSKPTPASVIRLQLDSRNASRSAVPCAWPRHTSLSTSSASARCASLAMRPSCLHRAYTRL